MKSFRLVTSVTAFVSAAVLAVCIPSCGNKSKDSSPDPTPSVQPGANTALTFLDVKAVLTESCSPCHSDGHRAPFFVEHEDVMKTPEVREKIIAAITTTDRAKMMPKPSNNKPLTEDEKTTFLVYLGKGLPAPGAAAVTYANDIGPLTAAKCTPCHTDKGGRKPGFVEHEDIVLANANAIAHAISATNPKEIMPPVGKVLSPEGRAKILEFLGASSH